MSRSDSMPHHVTGLQAWAWAAVEHLLDPASHPHGTPLHCIAPTVSTSRDHTGGWTVTVTVTDREPPGDSPGSWTVMATADCKGSGATFRSADAHRAVANSEVYAAWLVMLADGFDAWKRAVSDGQPAAIEEAPTSIATFRRALNTPASDQVDIGAAFAVNAATKARAAVNRVDHLITDWQRVRDTDRPQMSDNMRVEAALLRWWANAPCGSAHVPRWGSPIAICSLASAYNHALNDPDLVSEFVALADNLADQLDTARGPSDTGTKP